MFRCFSGAIYINRNNDPLASVTVSAEMNGLPAWNMVSNLLQFRLPKNSAKNSFTWLMAVYPTTIGNLALVEEGANENLNKFWISSATAMRFHTSNTGGIFEQKAAGTVLPLNTRGIQGVSFDYATRKSSILFAAAGPRNTPTAWPSTSRPIPTQGWSWAGAAAPM